MTEPPAPTPARLGGRHERVRPASGSDRRRTASPSAEIADDWAVIIRAGVWHDVVNTGSDEVKLHSIYSPPEHRAGTVRLTEADAEPDEHHL